VGTAGHGDYVCITPSRAHNGGGVVMLGRSDGVLNPGGVRFGSAELYDVVARECAGTVERVVLALLLPAGETLTPALEARVRAAIRTARSPRHVPAVVRAPPLVRVRAPADAGGRSCRCTASRTRSTARRSRCPSRR
jgi:acyl-coenzyme A synthetase/AMP-(fatty) acid ligase